MYSFNLSQFKLLGCRFATSISTMPLISSLISGGLFKSLKYLYRSPISIDVCCWRLLFYLLLSNILLDFNFLYLSNVYLFCFYTLTVPYQEYFYIFFFHYLYICCRNFWYVLKKIIFTVTIFSTSSAACICKPGHRIITFV